MNDILLITGASSGIGRATALYLDKAGFTVYAGVRQQEDAVSLESEGTKRLKPIILDVTKSADIDACFETLKSETKDIGLRGIINNAGISYISPFEFTDENKARQLMEVNFFGLCNITQKLIPLLKQYARKGKQPAKIINVSSIGGAIGIPWEPYYNASKFAVVGISQSLRFELDPLNIKVSTIMPGIIKTPIFEKIKNSTLESLNNFPENYDTDYYKRSMQIFLHLEPIIKKFGSKPEKVAKAILNVVKSKNPKLKILVGNDAKIFYFLERILPSSLFHSIFGKQFVKK